MRVRMFARHGHVASSSSRSSSAVSPLGAGALALEQRLEVAEQHDLLDVAGDAEGVDDAQRVVEERALADAGPRHREVVVRRVALRGAVRLAQDDVLRPAVFELEQRVLLVGLDREAEPLADVQQGEDRDLGVAGEPLARDLVRRAAAAVGQARDDLPDTARAAERVVLHEHLDGADVGGGSGAPAVLAQLHGEPRDRSAVARDGDVGGVLQHGEIGRHLAGRRGLRGELVRGGDIALEVGDRRQAHLVGHMRVQGERQLPRPLAVVDRAQRGGRP